MATSAGIKKLFTSRYVVGFPEQRLAYLSGKIAEQRADYCVVLQPRSLRYLGTFRIAEVATLPGAENRILSDLLRDSPFVDVLPNVDTRTIERLLMREGMAAVPVVDHESQFVGLITSESVVEYALREERKRVRRLSREHQANAGLVLPFDTQTEDESGRKDA